jgi:hypothetical protein
MTGWQWEEIFTIEIRLAMQRRFHAKGRSTRSRCITQASAQDPE